MRTTLVSSLLLSSVSVSLAQLTVPTLPGSWQYEGCYTDVPGRTIGAATYASGTAMTNEACIAYCENLGFQYAGTEYSVECFCGASLAPAAELVAGAQCNMACSGDATQPCGGGSRLTLFRNPTVTGPQTNPGVGDYTHLGCYSEGTTGRALTHGVSGAIIPPASMTVALCIAACEDAGFNLAGVEYASECFCGNSIQNGGAPATGCNMLCNGNNQEFCGAGSRLNIYANSQYSASTTAATAVTTATTATGTAATTAITTAAAPSQPAEVDNFEWHGCRTEATGMRALSAATFASDTMTLEACRAFCADYTYFGVEYSRECYCGNSFNAGSAVVAGSQCSMTCMGNPSQYCGAGDRLSVYAKDGTAPPPTSTTTGSTTTTPIPTVTGLPAGWESYGCYREGTTGRALPHQLVDSPSNTPAECASRCIAAGYSIAGTEYGAQCFCANAIYNGGAPAPIGECNVNCPGNAAQKCGGGDRLNIVAADTPQTYAPPAPQQGIANWTYQGCYEDNLNGQRTFHWQILFPGVMTPKMCLDRCSSFGYQAAGLEYGEECFCGDPRNIPESGAGLRPDSECGIVCPGNASAICGGGSRLTTYFWSGTPLYQYTWPQDYRAGQYQFFVNGLNIPLITQETITGKVSFISKAGTGPGNETGAYELDPSRVQPGVPWQSAWRELHLKTDVFCAAGVTLPDKVGRQLNVGGWSGESTYGTRLYWPDDTGPGDWGVNDWQEDVAKLSLQEGRWYPSVMTMANGSIFVIGGEVGSNAAAVPTIEVLPYTGRAPIRREWLARTDPNNLYPFVAVLPSGGIFVAYWNEARIIDPVNFDDVKVLPNAPGAVNDPLAGRTYPMQGTAVLLPQKAPYTEPLGVLICGGSTIGVANALDNCVSTYPDEANPTWTLERMPTFRVMPIMAPLPDGTYWIGGGAKHGVAGFGLANRPNLNSLLYDPSKPVGQRITVAANTTIARMYHSEAITLLDGRVLVSGSNPEDGVNPEEYRVEVFVPPYLLKPGVTRPTFTITAANKDWAYGQSYTFTIGTAPVNGAITTTLLGSVSSTHGNSMGARTLMPAVSCTGTTCTVQAPPNANICPPGWYQFFVLDGGIPAVGVYVRIGGDPAGLGNWPNVAGFDVPGL